MDKEEFLELVAQAIDELPEKVHQQMDNVEVVVEDHLRPALSHEMGFNSNYLLGLYQGIPLNKRGFGYGLVLPDKITLFQDTIEAVCSNSRKKIVEQISNTLIHEIGHHFGFSEAQIRRLTKGK